MRVAIYGRKSIYSDRSSSIENQFRMCREYVSAIYSDESIIWTEYQDEAYSGANTHRPDLTRLLDDVKLGLVDALAVYQLDRLTRSVRDFANIYAVLDENGVKFISVKENIDTGSPIGRAMMYITVVFAQMERETIANRTRDNLRGLAQKGLWVGGPAPTGYISKRGVFDGKSHVYIVPDADGVRYVQWLFNEFISSGVSLQALQTRFKREGIRSYGGYFLGAGAMYNILTSPCYVEDTPEIYDYYDAQGCQMIGSRNTDWDGTHGVLIYGKTTRTGGNHRRNPPSGWLVAPGAHEPIIKADQWLAAQSQFTFNKVEYTSKYEPPLLKGVLRCSCGGKMAVATKKAKNGVCRYYYCTRRAKYGEEECPRKMVRCDELDTAAMEKLSTIGADRAAILEYIESENGSQQNQPPIDYDAEIAKRESQIRRFTDALGAGAGASATRYILDEMDRIAMEIDALKRERTLVHQNDLRRAATADEVSKRMEDVERIVRSLDGFSATEKNAAVRSAVKVCIWDGESLDIRL